jgi:Tfp pilus assembly protein PilN
MVGLWMIAFVTTIVGGILTIRDHKRAQEEQRVLLLQDQRSRMMDQLAEVLGLSLKERTLFEVLQSYRLVPYAQIEAQGMSIEEARAVLITLGAKVAPLGLKVVAVYETGYVLVKEL